MTGNTRRLHRWLAAAAVVFGLASAAACAGEIRIGGAGTTLGAMALLGAAFEKTAPDVKVKVDMKSKASVGGVRALQKGEFDLALASRELSDTDVEGMSKLQAMEIARVPFVFAVNAATSVKGVSSAELLQIYQLKKTTWEDGSRIVLVPRTAQISDTLYLKELSKQWEAAVDSILENPAITKFDTAQDAADLVEKRQGAITTSTLGLIRAEKRTKMKPLLIDGAEPTSKAYRYYKPIILVAAASPAPEVTRFVQFLCTKTAEKIMEDNGYAVTLDKARCARR